jgi:hypothetical protein
VFNWYFEMQHQTDKPKNRGNSISNPPVVKINNHHKNTNKQNNKANIATTKPSSSSAATATNQNVPSTTTTTLATSATAVANATATATVPPVVYKPPPSPTHQSSLTNKSKSTITTNSEVPKAKSPITASTTTTTTPQLASIQKMVATISPTQTQALRVSGPSSDAAANTNAKIMTVEVGVANKTTTTRHIREHSIETTKSGHLSGKQSTRSSKKFVIRSRDIFLDGSKFRIAQIGSLYF